MANVIRRFIVVAFAAVALLGAAACESVRATVSPSPAIVSVSGTISASPGSTSLGQSITVSWSASSAVRVDVCQTQCTTLSATASSGRATHTPSASGEWRYVLYGVAAEPDVSVRLAEARVTVQ